MNLPAYTYVWGCLGLDKRQIRRMLRMMGYSEKALKEVLKWYE